MLYTTRLGLHDLASSQSQSHSDRSLITMSRISAYVDWEKAPQYPITKGAVRTLMKCSIRMTWKQGIGVNDAAPGQKLCAQQVFLNFIDQAIQVHCDRDDPTARQIKDDRGRGGIRRDGGCGQGSNETGHRFIRQW